MANKETSSIYKGHFITTRWVLDSATDSACAQRFSASFTVHPPDPCRSSWQQFPRKLFGTLVAAIANALADAMGSIDHDIALVNGQIGKPEQSKDEPPEPSARWRLGSEPELPYPRPEVHDRQQLAHSVEKPVGLSLDHVYEGASAIAKRAIVDPGSI